MSSIATNPDLQHPPTQWRGPVALGVRADGKAVDREGGDNGAGIIRGAAVITRGEALGHGMWIDGVMLQQTHDAIRAAGKRGVKARFTHPGLSSDGLGTFLGRYKNPRLDGDVVRADIHFAKSARSTPDGDLAEYVMQLAESDPEAFGNSIVFRHDFEAEEQFELDNQHEVEETDRRGKPIKRLRFRSPDPNNVKHYPHARLKQLRAIDAVDSPAANPSGMFHATDVAGEADRLLSYACGLSSDKPALSCFDIDPDRISGFVAKFLDRHNLTIQPKRKESSMTTHPKQDASPVSAETQPDELSKPEAETDPKPPAQPEAKPATLGELKAAFPKSSAEWREGQLEKNATIQQATSAYAAQVEEQLAAAEARNAELQQRLAAAPTSMGETSPLSDGASGAGTDSAADEQATQYESACGSNLGRYAQTLKLAATPSQN